MSSLTRLRNGKARLAVGVSLFALTLLVTYVIHNTRTKLASARTQALDCEHKRESLAAQLQVTGEHKSRLEKALQHEKSSHKHTKDKLESQYEELQEHMDKEKQESLKKYSLLQQQFEASQTQQDNLHKEFSELQQTNSELQQEKLNQANKFTSQLDQLRITKDEELLQLQNSYSALLHEKEELQKKSEKSPLIRQLESNFKECKTELSSVRQTLSRLKGLESNVGNDKPPIDLKPVKLNGEMESKHEMAYVASMPELDNKRSDSKFQNDEQKRVGPPPPMNGNRNPSHASPHKIDDHNDGHQLAIPAVALEENKNKDEGGRQMEGPNGHGRNDDSGNQKKGHQLAEPPFAQIDMVGRDIKQGVDRRDAELVANGLEQQENGEDQDLDNMENEVLGGIGDRKENNRFEDADFDQADQDDNDGNRINVNPQFQGKQEGVVAAPHK